MEAKKVIEIQAESYIEEQLLMDAFPEAVWFTGVGSTRFYLPYNRKEDVKEKMREWRDSERMQ
jgi:hypothetical protein